MDEQRSPLKSELKFLERLSIEELEALLKLSGDPNDVELLFDTVVEEVVAREKENPTGRLPDVDVAWDELQARYQTMPDTGSHPQFQEQSTDSTAAEPLTRPKRWDDALSDTADVAGHICPGRAWGTAPLPGWGGSNRPLSHSPIRFSLCCPFSLTGHRLAPAQSHQKYHNSAFRKS